MTNFLVHGFKRSNTSVNVTVLVGAEAFDPTPEDDLYALATATAEGIAGPEYCFISTENILRPVPDTAKHKLFLSDKELYAAAPELNPKKPRRPDRRQT